jgi:hypothetical protein
MNTQPANPLQRLGVTKVLLAFLVVLLVPKP